MAPYDYRRQVNNKVNSQLRVLLCKLARRAEGHPLKSFYQAKGSGATWYDCSEELPINNCALQYGNDVPNL